MRWVARNELAIGGSGPVATWPVELSNARASRLNAWAQRFPRGCPRRRCSQVNLRERRISESIFEPPLSRHGAPAPCRARARFELEASSAEFAQPARVGQGQAHQILGFKLAESTGNCGVLAERLMTVRATTIGNQQSWDRVPTMTL